MLKVAARRRRQVLSLRRSRWTTEATPFSRPMAVAGYQGFTSLETRLGIFGLRTLVLGLGYSFSLTGKGSAKTKDPSPKT